MLYTYFTVNLKKKKKYDTENGWDTEGNRLLYVVTFFEAGCK